MIALFIQRRLANMMNERVLQDIFDTSWCMLVDFSGRKQTNFSFLCQANVIAKNVEISARIYHGWLI